jgi:hypothetical protein
MHDQLRRLPDYVSSSVVQGRQQRQSPGGDLSALPSLSGCRILPEQL